MKLSRILPLAIPVAQIWVRSQRKRYRFGDKARSLTDGESAVLVPFFDPGLLRKVKITGVTAFPNPWFYPVVRHLGIDLPDVPHASAVTFDDTIVVVGDANQTIRDWYALLFHELVHVVQYSILGLDLFIDRYLHAFAVVGSEYEQNEFEREAYTLQSRFQSAPAVSFSVKAEVLRRNRAGFQKRVDV